MVPVAAVLPNDVDVLKGTVIAYATENELLHEQVRLLRAQLYGRKSEKMVGDGAEQLPLFPSQAETSEPASPKTSETKVESHSRRKPGRQPLPEHLPRVRVVHDVSETEKQCACGCAKQCIGEEVSEQLDIQPARMQVLCHVRPKYACRKCEGTQDSGPTVSIAPPPPQLIPKSIGSAGLVAHVITAKYVDAVPFYRQESQFARLGVELGRATMCNWLVKAAERCSPLMRLLREEIKAGPLINADETTLQVLDEPGREATTKSYIWVFRGGQPGRPALEFVYDETRGSVVPEQYFRGYVGEVQTDGYVAYQFLDKVTDIVHGGCMAHVRRGFDDILKAAGKGSNPYKRTGSAAEDVLLQIAEIYRFDKAARKAGLEGDALLAWKAKYLKERFDALKAWLEEKKILTPPQGLLGKAIAYALNQWHRLEKYLDSSVLRLDNNLAENAIRPFVIGRKNWLFSGTPDGARASATMYSLIETAKANGLEPNWYLRVLFARLPVATTEADYKALLPQYINRDLKPD